MKYYEILPTHTETPRNTTRKIANLCIEFNYHFLTLQKKIPLLLNRSVYQVLNWFPHHYDVIMSTMAFYIMAGHAIVVVKDIILLFYHGNAVILTLR